MKLERAATPKAIETTFYVTGDTGEKYTVHFKRHQTKHRRVWTCNCRDFTERQVFTGGTCKHIDFTIVSLDAPVPQNNNVLSRSSGSYEIDHDHAAPTAKSVLDGLVSFLNQKTPETAYVWWILTALRGPDDGSMCLKDETTSRIRHAVGLQASRQFIVEGGSPLGLDQDSPSSTVKRRYPRAEHHFLNHYEKALNALLKLGYLK